MVSNAPVVLEKPASNGAPPQSPPASEPTQDGDPSQYTRSACIDHMADYAVAINRSLCKSRSPKDRIFQVGGRRRLLFASAVAVRRLNRHLALSKTACPEKVCRILADLAV